MTGPSDPRWRSWREDVYEAYGFAVLEADSQRLSFSIIGAEEKELYAYTLNK
jgi:hypothetical protein